MLVIIIPILLLAVNQGQCLMTATADLKLDGTSTSIGSITFVQNDAGSPVVVSGKLIVPGANNSNHGFHVHTAPVSETSPNCTVALGHFNPYNTVHGPRAANISYRHVGDLGNLTADANGAITIDLSDSIIQLYNLTQSIVNRTIIIHQMYDDGGNTNSGTSNTTGNAGIRVACGLIKMVSDGPATGSTTLPTTAASTAAPATTAASTAAPATTPSTAAPTTTPASTVAPATTSASTEAPATTPTSTEAPTTTPSTAAPTTTPASTEAPATTPTSTEAPATTPTSTEAPTTTPSTAAPTTTPASTVAPPTTPASTAAPPTTPASTMAQTTTTTRASTGLNIQSTVSSLFIALVLTFMIAF